MAEFIGEEKLVSKGEPIVFENKTDSSFDVGMGVVFHRSGIYEVSILGNRTVVSKVTERKTGKWIKVHGFCTPGGDSVWACSECGKGIHVYGIEHGTYGADVSDGQWKACPNCGARMRGDAE